MSSLVQRVLFCGAAILLSPLCQADSGGTLQFYGRIVEPPCVFSTAPIHYQDKQKLAAPLELDVRCHSRQAVRLSFLQGGRETRAGFDTGVTGVTMSMSRDGKPLPPGEVTALALAARSQQRIRIDTRLQDSASNTDPAGHAQSKAHGELLIALDYH
ncbi:hypothetical protein J8I26_07465 [Herbaspirillum sp. LeCh32-8]|uniref:hypothetical protein n=1 Tax=Herbaspirillum sp. LeCh32-8 TaxID=2821356 RepID=UPI001AE35DD4|nr:hypothetical protein [Herbaspirillum sp. LeCh32-8]MBP0597933.1 hypothetical protein [Herbaspirillum sp. LeCh32-8]